MATQQLDVKGMRCPQPILQITMMMPKMAPGDVLEVTADCESFEQDVRAWCERLQKSLLAVERTGSVAKATIQF